ncbi:MAG: glycosyl transferase family 2, partial [Frankiales bacterium]|nr:glycosyl transferase family 2 [Frankiales bacterium]
MTAAQLARPAQAADLPTVSVIVPCYRYGHFLPQCVESVTSQIGVDVQVLIIDDASGDGSADVARGIAAQDDRVHVVVHEVNKGHLTTYDEGFAWADGAFTVLLSADDLLVPGSLARATTLMSAHPEVGFVYGRSVYFVDQPPALRTGPGRPHVWNGHDWARKRFR